MFGFKKAIDVAPTLEEVAILKLPQRPTPRPKSDRPATIVRMDEYTALAKELGIASAKTGHVLQRMVADFLWEHNIEMYRYSDVTQYMSALAEQDNEIFYWRPLRERDIPPSGQYGNWGWGTEKEHDCYRPRLWQCRPYNEIVPFEILQNVKLLEDKFPGLLHFFVTDYADADADDPFIMVTARDMSRIVFGVWDEPDFFKTNTP